MSSQEKKLREKASRLAAKRDTGAVSVKPAEQDQEKQDERTPDDRKRALAPAPKPHVKPVRSTVDLAPARHAALKSWCGETAVEIGRSRVTTQDVMRVLVARLLTDETFARQIRDDLRAETQ